MSPAVTRALAYPFDPPSEPFVLQTGSARPFDRRADAGLLVERVPVLAVGSNGSPRRLVEKLGPGAVLAVTRARVAGHVTAHSAKITSYGAMPATLHPWPGAWVEVGVTWLDEGQLAMMDATEALGVEYERVDLAAVGLDGEPIAGAQTYLSRAGALSVKGRPAVSAASRSGGHGLSAYSQREAQGFAMAALGAEGPVEDFIAANLADPSLRQQRSAQLSTRFGLPSLARPS